MGRIMKPWIRSWPSEEEEELSLDWNPSTISRLRVSLGGLTAAVTVGTFFILFKAVPTAAATTVPSPFPSMTPPLSDSATSIFLDPREPGLTLFAWAVGLVCFLAFAAQALNLIGPRDVFKLVKHVTLLLQEEIKHRRFTCNSAMNGVPDPGI